MGTGETQEQVAVRLLTNTVVDFTSKIVTYSTCNHSFLTKALRVIISSSEEVETLLVTLAKLLGQSNIRVARGAAPDSTSAVSLPTGAIHWISSLTEAHIYTV